MSMVEKVRMYIEKHHMIKNGETIILGISGGADSVCLFFVLLELQKYYDIQIVAVHVNHNLRGEDANRDQRYVEHVCREHNVRCIIIDENVKEESKKRKKSLEETGREVRLEAFERIQQNLEKEMSCDVKIATAHHCNDNVETLLMNLTRGTGLMGLTGIAPVRGNRIRPLLEIERREIEEYLRSRTIEYCEDHTNYENIYSRNIIRNKVLPILEEDMNEQVISHMSATITELSKVELFLKEQLEISWDMCVEIEKSGIMIDKSILELQPELMRERIIKKAIEKVAEQQRDIIRVHITAVCELLDKQVGREVHLPYEVVAKRCYKGIYITRRMNNKYKENDRNRNEKKNQKLQERYNSNEYCMGKQGEAYDIQIRIIERDSLKQIKETPYTKYFDYDIMEKVPCIRTRNSGDQIVINANGNKQSLKKYYITNKIPESQRDEIPLLTIDYEVLWVIGYRRSSAYIITEDTKQILEVQYNGGNHGRNN